MALPDCTISQNGEISAAFLDKGITTFAAACTFIKSIPYGRNENKEAYFCVFNENRGTCSTKHALLKRLADENGLDIALVTGIYKMDRSNTPGIGDTLQHYGISYMPEAHNYLKSGGEIFDFTFPEAKATGFDAEVLQEHEIEPNQVTDYKVALHKSFLTSWLLANNTINLPLGRLWEIREECIAALSEPRNN